MPAFRPPDGLQPRGKLRILVADDQEQQRRGLQSLLVPRGICVFAGSGQEVLSRWEAAWRQDAPFDLICLGLPLPGLAGPGVLQALRSWETSHEVAPSHAVRVILIAGSDEDRRILDACRDPCAACLVTPFPPGDLEDRLTRLGLTGIRADARTDTYCRWR